MNTPFHQYNMGVIGNCSYLAYIDKNADVKWLCMPRFDSSFLFGSLLDEKKGGHFYVKPKSETFKSEQYYIENTNILCTEFENEDGKFRVTDFAPRFMQHDRYFRPLMLFRKIEPLEGRPQIRVSCKPVGDYGRMQPEVLKGSSHIRYLNIGEQVRLATNISLNLIEEETSFVLSETKYLVFSYGVPLEAGIEETCEAFLDKTKKYWTSWIKTTSIPSIYQKEIIRSSLVLKLHQYEDTGGIIASGSMSLPEFHLSGRNWDYRYCWMRDTYYTLNALNSLGHFEESIKYFQYIENIIVNAKDRIQPLYSILGESKITEVELGLDGYLGQNTPVRLGNDAYTHIQNDVYGQVLVSLLPIFTDKRLSVGRHYKSDEIIHFLLDQIEATMYDYDAGLWEFRNLKQQHCYTYLFHWAGSKAALKIGKELQNPKITLKAEKLIDLAAEQIEKCYHEGKQAYAQAVGSEHMDASCLKLITMNYLDPNSDRAKNHLKALEAELRTEKGLFYRYRHADDFGTPHTTFLICAFWYTEALACVGRTDDAVKVFDELIKTGNHLGILSEDVDVDGSQWGNFPQTYSHVGLMNTAFRIARKKDLPIFF